VLVLQKRANVFIENTLIEVILFHGERRVENVLSLLGERVLDIHLQSSQEKGLENEMQIRNEFGFLFCGDDSLVSFCLIESGKVKPALKFICIIKDFGQDKVEQTPEFAKVILEGRPGEEQSIGRLVTLEFLDQFAV
jgi:hypothetical protein